MNDTIIPKSALLIGINYYPILESSRQLSGCVNDVLLFKKILVENFQFLEEKIKILLSEHTNGEILNYDKPTRDNILRALDDLVSNTQQDERVVIFYSGHGSRKENNSKHTGWNETIVPCDSGRSYFENHQNRDITDDEIHQILGKLCKKTSYITLVFDSCHSGSITRDSFGPNARYVPPDDSQTPLMDNNNTKGEDRGESGWLPLSQNYVLLAGCRDDESSYEFYVHKPEQKSEVVRHGAWTYYLCQELCTAKSGVTYQDVFEKSSPLVTKQYVHQHPQLEGAIHREIFGIRNIEPQSFLSVLSVDNVQNTVKLAGGAAHGVTEGSRWSVHPPTTRLATKETQSSLLEITQVRAITSDAKIVESNPQIPIQINSRAFEEAHDYGRMRLPVMLVIPDVQGEVSTQATILRDLITRSKLLLLTDNVAEAKVKIYLINPRNEAKETDPVPQIKHPILIPTWVVVNQQGKLCFPACNVNWDETTQIFDNLEKMARHVQGLELQNKDPHGILQGKIEFELLKKKEENGSWEPARSENQQGGIYFHEGEWVGARITNKHTKEIFVTVVEFAEDGSIEILHEEERLQPGATFTIGNEFQPIKISQAYLDMCKSIPATDMTSEPLETFKVFATTQPTKFNSLTQSAYRGRREGEDGLSKSPLGRLLESALAEGHRIMTRKENIEKEEWTTIQLSFTIKPSQDLINWLDSPCNAATWNPELWQEYLTGKPTAKGDIFKFVVPRGPEVTLIKEKYAAANPDLDIVFIHGIFGDEEESWTNENNTFWPLWLKDDLKGFSIRLLAARHKGTHGNNTIAQISQEVTEQLRQCGVGSRSTIFICHSLGGIIAKKVLCLDKTIASVIKAIVFYGTPHDGSIQANRLVRYTLLNWRSVTAKDLQLHSLALQNIQTEFASLLKSNPAKIMSFVETKPVGGFLIVTEPSAKFIGYGNFESVPHNHVDICKPLTRQAVTYQKLLEFLSGKLPESTYVDEALRYDTQPMTNTTRSTQPNSLWNFVIVAIVTIGAIIIARNKFK